MMALGLLEILILLAIVFAIASAVKSGNKKPLMFVGILLLLGGIFVSFSLVAPRVVSSAGGPISTGVRMKIGIFPILLLPIILAGAALFLKVKNKKKVLTTILLIGVIVTLGIMGVRYFQYDRHFSNTQYPAIEEASNYEVMHNDRDLATIWKTGIEDQFNANIYPSGQAAVNGLIKRMFKTLDEIPDTSSILQTIQLSHNTDNRYAEMIEIALRDKFKNSVHEIRINKSDIMKLDDTGQNLFVLQLIMGQPHNSDPVNCNLYMHFRSVDKLTQKKWDTTYTDKPWVNNFADYCADNPSQSFTLARSQGSCLTQEEAQRQAEQSACLKISNILQEKRKNLTSSQHLLPSTFTVNPNDLVKYRLITDRFSQEFYGSNPIWRQAILLDTSSDKIDTISNDKFELDRYVYQSWGEMLAKLLGIIALITVVYLFLNIATRGYYTWSLRIAAVVLLVIGIIFLLIFGI